MVEKGMMKFGEVSVELDPTSLLKSLDNLEKLQAGAVQKLALALNLPVEPFERRLLKPVLMGTLQNEWYQAYEGAIPPQCILYQEKRVARYKEQLEELKNHTGEDVVTSRKVRTPSDKAPRVSKMYVLNVAKADIYKAFKGQKYLIIKAMTEAGKALSVDDISGLVQDTPETKAPSKANCAFHINAFGHEGVVTAVDSDGKAVPVEPKETPAPKAEAPKVAPPATAKKSDKKKK